MIFLLQWTGEVVHRSQKLQRLNHAAVKYCKSKVTHSQYMTAMVTMLDFISCPSPVTPLLPFLRSFEGSGAVPSFLQQVHWFCVQNPFQGILTFWHFHFCQKNWSRFRKKYRVSQKKLQLGRSWTSRDSFEMLRLSVFQRAKYKSRIIQKRKL